MQINIRERFRNESIIVHLNRINQHNVHDLEAADKKSSNSLNEFPLQLNCFLIEMLGA